MTLSIPCPHCADGFTTQGDRHARTAKDVCGHCGGTHRAPARTGETAATSYDPRAGSPEVAAEAWHALAEISALLALVADDLGGPVEAAFTLAEDALAEGRQSGAIAHG
ncbi:hypothetical protein [Methylobacterium sp. CCH5-D2]|uniref:hypothetical protein n=1 Tax=Methylobacterium sp. CCH5-D2 TaxID=1768765 RepID=UPI00083645AC|nr:hypothetical protein [Methylobacterium sp. CCH5-D2]